MKAATCRELRSSESICGIRDRAALGLAVTTCSSRSASFHWKIADCVRSTASCRSRYAQVLDNEDAHMTVARDLNGTPWIASSKTRVGWAPDFGASVLPIVGLVAFSLHFAAFARPCEQRLLRSGWDWCSFFKDLSLLAIILYAFEDLRLFRHRKNSVSTMSTLRCCCSKRSGVLLQTSRFAGSLFSFLRPASIVCRQNAKVFEQWLQLQSSQLQQGKM